MLGALAITGGAIATRPDRLEAEALLDPGYIIPLAVATTVVLAAVKRWLRQHETRTKADVAALAEQHRHRAAELDKRESAISSREVIADRREATYNLRMRSLAQRLDEERTAHTELRVKHHVLELNYNEVIVDYNALIEQVILDGRSRFNATTTGKGTHSPPLPCRDDRHLTPYKPVAYLHPQGRHNSG